MTYFRPRKQERPSAQKVANLIELLLVLQSDWSVLLVDSLQLMCLELQLMPKLCIVVLGTRRLQLAAAAAAKSRHLCPTLCDPIDDSPLGSSVPGMLQTRILEWVAISFSNARMHAKSFQSCLTLCDAVDSSPPGSPVPEIL